MNKNISCKTWRK